MEAAERGDVRHNDDEDNHHDDDHDDHRHHHHHHDHDNVVVGIIAGSTLYSTVGGVGGRRRQQRRPPPTHQCFCWLVVVNVCLLAVVAALVAVLLLDKSSTSSTLSPSTDDSSLSNLITWRPLPDSTEILTRIAFGSCSSQRMPQPYWDTLVTAYKPDLLLLMGDNVYGDCHADGNHTTSTTTTNETDNMALACAPLRQAYRDMAQHASVQGAARQLSVFATLDDHDYGTSDADQFNPFKHVAKQYFVEFFGLQDEQLPPDGVYRSRVWGPVGKRVQVILLDTRFGRSPFYDKQETKEGLGLNSTTTSTTTDRQMLSARQWDWLEQQLQVDAELRLVVSSIQVLNDETNFECWRHIPAERERLYDLLRDKSVMLVSGDRHVGGFYGTQDGLIHEVTASSWTHTIPFGAFGSNCSSAETCDEVDPRRIGDLVRMNHFGSVDIDWEKRTVTMSLRRAESSYGVPYVLDYPVHLKKSDAGEVVQEHTMAFPF